MPTINKVQRYTVKPERNTRSHLSADKTAERQNIYNKPKWHLTRKAVMVRDSGLCQVCLHRERVKYTPGGCVHHLHSFMSVNNPDTRLQIAYDTNNLICICSKCHNQFHGIVEAQNLNQDNYDTPEKIAKLIDDYNRKITFV